MHGLEKALFTKCHCVVVVLCCCACPTYLGTLLLDSRSLLSCLSLAPSSLPLCFVTGPPSSLALSFVSGPPSSLALSFVAGFPSSSLSPSSLTLCFSSHSIGNRVLLARAGGREGERGRGGERGSLSRVPALCMPPEFRICSQLLGMRLSRSAFWESGRT